MAKDKQSAGAYIKEIKRRTRRTFSSEEKIKIVLEGLRGEDSISAICRKYSIHENLYYKWNKEFIEAGKKRLNGDTVREAGSDEVNELRKQNNQLRDAVADLTIENRVLKKSLNGLG